MNCVCWVCITCIILFEVAQKFFFSILTVNIMKSFLHRHYLNFFFYRVNLGCCMHEHVLVLGVDLVQMHEILYIN